MRVVPYLVALLAAAPAAGQMTPGNWRIVTTIDSMEMPGAPPGVAAMMKGRPMTINHCLTAEEAARGPQDMMKANKSCRFTRYSAIGGRIASVMTCQQGGGTMTATSSGSFTPAGFTATGRTMMTGPQAMTMSSTTTGKLLGPCK